MLKLAIIGAGISGLIVARTLKDKYEVTVFEKEPTPGGMLRCENYEAGLFHTCGGHMIENMSVDTMRVMHKVLDIDKDFEVREKNSSVLFENGEVYRPDRHGMFKKRVSEIEGVPNPIEKHIFMFKPEIQEQIVRDLFKIKARQKNKRVPKYLATYLKAKFGDTLYNLYFKPYNEKVWLSDLKKVPMEWFDGRLNAPTPEEILMGNFQLTGVAKTTSVVFHYPIQGGSQTIIDKMADGINMKCGINIQKISKDGESWLVDGERFDKLVFCGNVSDLVDILDIDEIENFKYDLQHLRYHGTTSVFVKMAKNNYSEIYLPGKEHKARKIVCTGNFAEQNNKDSQYTTGTVEFTDYISDEDIRYELAIMPLQPKYITHKFTKCTHPIQDEDTRSMIKNLKNTLAPMGMYLTGRFADWEYYNIDRTIQAAIKTCEEL